MNPDCEARGIMRGLIIALFIGALPAAAHAVDRPDWAFPSPTRFNRRQKMTPA